MVDRGLSLDAIGLECGTDKSSAHHGYLEFYERFFAKLRLAKIRILEIGVLNGASLRTWQRYFPNATVIGADIDYRARRHAAPRIDIEILDQSNIQDLVDLAGKHGPFDIIIEDGSHMWEHQITTFRTLFPFVKPHGYYVVEDLQTNFGKLGPSYKGVATESCVEYLKKLVDLRVADEQIDIVREEDAFLRAYGGAVELMVFARHVCLMEKGPKFRPNFVNTPLVELDPRHILPALTMMAHVGQHGDIENRHAAFINCAHRRQFIQGFALRSGDPAAATAEYRARLASGDWTPWLSCDAFAGTRGKGESLTGFAVRLTGGLESALDISAAGAFGNDDAIVVAMNGADCTTEPLKPLRAMQIIMRPR